MSTETYALTTEALDLGMIRNDWLPSAWLATIQVNVESRTGTPVFVGIGLTEEVDEYLEDVSFSEVIEIDSDFDVTYRTEEQGGSPSSLPSEYEFWAASAQGEGSLSIDWDIEEGEWTVVVMNADATPDVAVDVSGGAKTPWFIGITIGMLVVGLFSAVVAAIAGVFAFRGRETVAYAAAVHEVVEGEPVLSGVDDDAAR
jgi:hypothetical protein